MDPQMIAALASGATGALDYLGQRQTNAQNKDIWRKTQDWQEMMSNTAWQRGVADMKKAGINPMLAVSQGGASTPGATVGAPMINPMGGITKGVASAVQLALMKKQVEKLESETQLNKDSSNKVKVDTRNAATQTPGLEAQALWNANSLANVIRIGRNISSAIPIPGRQLFRSGVKSFSMSGNRNHSFWERFHK